jgi:serine/threonine protein kinase
MGYEFNPQKTSMTENTIRTADAHGSYITEDVESVIDRPPSSLPSPPGLRTSHGSLPDQNANHQQILIPSSSHQSGSSSAVPHDWNPSLHGRSTAVHDFDLPHALAPQLCSDGFTALGYSVFSSTGPAKTTTPATLSSSSAADHNLFWNGVHRILGPADKDPFINGSFLGKGSVGVVEEVLYTIGASESWVRKKFSLQPHLREQQRKIIQKEAEVLRSLDHSHIVKLLGTYEDAIRKGRPSTYCLLMSPVGDGDLNTFLNESLQSRIDEGRVGELEWLPKWFVCLASALKYMHTHGVLHEDIKPSNIVYRGDTVYFTDFSSSSLFEIGQTTSTDNFACSTTRYAAPEVSDRIAADGSPQRHGRGSDIFALGCVFSEMLTVLLSDSVSSFHDFLLIGTNENERRNLIYNRKVHRFDEWFGQARFSPPKNTIFLGTLFGSTFFDKCIRPMLAEDRRSRPEAHHVLTWTYAYTYRHGSIPCACML